MSLQCFFDRPILRHWENMLWVRGFVGNRNDLLHSSYVTNGIRTRKTTHDKQSILFINFKGSRQMQSEFAWRMAGIKPWIYSTRCLFYSHLYLHVIFPSAVSLRYHFIVNSFDCVVFKVFYDTNQLLSEKEIEIAPSFEVDPELKLFLWMYRQKTHYFQIVDSWNRKIEWGDKF